MIHGGTLRPPPRRTRRRSPAPRTQRPAFVAAHGAAIRPSRPTPRPAPHRYTLPASTRSDAASGGRNQIGRANRYKRTRRYLRDYQAGFQANPRVKRAQTQKARGERAYGKARERGAPAAAQRRALALMTSGRAAMEHEYRRGLDPIAASIYEAYGKRLWKRAKHAYPEPERGRPRQRVDYGPHSKRALAWVNALDRDTVHVSPAIIRAFTHRKGARGAAPTVLLHEWAHTRQPRLWMNTPATRAAREGGAEALNQALARELGLRYVQPTQEYQGFRRQAKKRGRRYVRKGQFQR